MAQSNYNIPNDGAPQVRTQLNAVFASVASNNSGVSAPGTTFAYQWWYDTTTDTLKMRNAANSGWIEVAEFDQGAGEIVIRGVEELSQGEVEDSASEAFGLVSGQRLAQAVAANLPSATGLGIGQTWQTPSRAAGTSYQNTTGQPIQVLVDFTSDGAARPFQVSLNNSTWTSIAEVPANQRGRASAIIPNDVYYRVQAGATLNTWAELREP